MAAMKTMYEGDITYLKFWNFWVRAATPVTPDWDYFFHDYENCSPEVWSLLGNIGAATAWPRNEKDVWKRIATVWIWLAGNVRTDNAAYSGLVDAVGRWPSIAELARYYADHDELVWSACFSKAHLFATLLGRVLPRWHTTVLSAHHTEGGAPPTASHVYVGIYLTDRWYYLDPTAVYAGPLPDFKNRRSVGLFSTVDYQHPFSALPVPLSPLDKVPYLPE
ncbi:MAG: transglutaminase domain-containing protein [Gammaproteobacteria bacterium]